MPDPTDMDLDAAPSTVRGGPEVWVRDSAGPGDRADGRTARRVQEGGRTPTGVAVVCMDRTVATGRVRTGLAKTAA